MHELRAPSRRRAERRRVVPTLTPDVSESLATLGSRATLVPFATTTAQILDPVTEDAALSQAIGAGQLAGPWEDGFPRYVWHRTEPVDSTKSSDSTGLTEFRLTGERPGEYIGYRLPPSYWPEGLQ